MLLDDCLKHSAIKYKDKIAVRCRNSSITYANLDRLSNKVAHCLISNGINPKSRIGIYMDKSINSIIAIFGILKAGSAYIALDTMSPIDTLNLFISKCEIDTIITENNKLSEIQDIISLNKNIRNIINLSQDKIHNKIGGKINYISHREISKELDNYCKIQGRSENDVAYLLTTSGSTGASKAVMMSHKNAFPFINWAIDYFKIDKNDVISNHALFSSCIHVFDIYTALKTGATVCLVPKSISFFPASMADFIYKNKITRWYSVPSTLIQLMTYKKLHKKHFSEIKTIVYGGQVFPYKKLNKLKSLLNDVDIVNSYGSSESQVVMFYKIPVNKLTSEAPIGKACPFAVVNIVDNKDNIVKKGQVGELIVSSETLMQGYYGESAKTEKAIRKINIKDTEQKFYFTGDLVVENKDGNLIYKGRIDNMIKSRGFRVYLEEIESILCQFDKIADVALIGIPDDNIGHIIKAVVVLKKGNSSNEEEIKNFCTKFVPPYMIPEIVEFRNDLPKTITGKVDRNKLK